MRHIRNDDSCGHKKTLYDNITCFRLFHERRIINENICGTEKHCDSSYVMQFNFNYFDAHPST